MLLFGVAIQRVVGARSGATGVVALDVRRHLQLCGHRPVFLSEYGPGVWLTGTAAGR